MKIKFFISCVSGTQSNPKKRGETRPQDPFRACINFFICYEKSIIQEHEIFQGFHNATDTKFENKPMVTKSSTNDRESIFRMLQQTVKVRKISSIISVNSNLQILYFSGRPKTFSKELEPNF